MIHESYIWTISYMENMFLHNGIHRHLSTTHMNDVSTVYAMCPWANEINPLDTKGSHIWDLAIASYF